MNPQIDLGRVVVSSRGVGARRVLRALHELARSGQAGSSVMLCEWTGDVPPYARDADEIVRVTRPFEEALRASGAQSAWLGAASLQHRVEFADACARAGVKLLGPSLEVLRDLVRPDALSRLAAELRIDVAPPPGAGTRLVEVVVARDRAGAVQALGIGDASLRRGDGVVVLAEAPSAALTSETDRRIRELGVRACVAVGWVGVCSIQLALDRPGDRVALAGIDALAHSAPAIEALTGIDLARLALTLGAGAPLEPHPSASSVRGHAFAARLEADDPELPTEASPGTIELLQLPSSLGVRADPALMQGDEAARGDKLAIVVARGESRPEALARLEQALTDADVLLSRSASSKAWLLALAQRPEVQEGRFDARFLEGLVASGERLVQRRPEAALLAGAIEGYEGQLDLERARFIAEARRGRPRVGPSAGRTLELRHEGLRHRFHVQQTAPDLYRVAQRGVAPVDVRIAVRGRLERRLRWEGARHRVLSARDGLRLLIEIDGVGHIVVREPTGVVSSPIPAVVVAIPVEVGQSVAAGDPVARVESMKSELEVKAPTAGVVREILAAVNSQVDAGGPLVRLGPEGAREADAAALPHAAPAGAPPAGARERYFASLSQLVPLLLGFDIGVPETRRLAAEWRGLAAAIAFDDAAVLAAEEFALTAFADVQSLFARARAAGQVEGPPPLEELWRYLHEPEKQGEGLTQRFRARLRRTLSHYGVSLESPGRSLELALLRIQKAHDRASDQVDPVASILERRLQGGSAPPGFGAADSRDVLERIAEVGAERFPVIADLAREVRFRRFDQPALEQGRAAAYAQAQADLEVLANPAEREAAIDRLVECPEPLAALLVARMADSAPETRARLVETLLRRYYRVRPLHAVRALNVDNVPCAHAEYDFDGEQFRVVACYSPAARVARAARVVARFISELPAGHESMAELYLGWDGPVPDADGLSALLEAALRGAGFRRPMRRVSIVLAMSGYGLQREQSQQHFVFRGGPEGWEEDRRFRGVHYLLFERMQLGRLSKFDLERLPSAEDIYLYRGVASSNPKDERLFAMAEVRGVSTIRDEAGRVVRIPQLERTLLEAAAGMRLAQARRPPQQRLFWNRIIVGVGSPLLVSTGELNEILLRLAPAMQGLGLEMLLVNARVPDPNTGELRELLVRAIPSGNTFSIQWDVPTRRPLEPMTEFQQRVVQLRRRGLIHPFEIIRMLVPPTDSPDASRSTFVEHDLDASGALVPVDRAPGQNTANVVVGVVRNVTAKHPEGMTRVAILGDPGREMGSVAEPECRRILAALELAERLGVPLEWFEVCAGAKISTTTGTENMDWVSAVLRRLIEFTQHGGEVNVVITGITVGAQPYWNAEATMLMHTRGILVMVPGSCMVLTGKQALDYSGSVSAEDNEGIGGYDRIMGPNGQAQYRAASVAEACSILMRHYDHSYVVPGERFPRRAPTSDPPDRDVRSYPHGPEGGAGFATVGDVLSVERNPDRKKPFEIRRIMAAVVDHDHAPLERWRDWRGGETGVVWDAHLGGLPVCLVGIQSRPLPRLEFVPADGPEFWSAGTLFPNSSKKIARAINSASGNRPLVVLANLSGFDGSPESMRRLQLEYGAEIGRAVVNFDGPIVFCVVSRYHGGAFVVFAKTLNESIEAVAVAGARASVIGGAPAAAVVFAREVDTRTRKDPRVGEAERAAAAGGAARAKLATVVAAVRSEKLGEVGEEFDRIHSVERALEVGSLDRIIAPAELRPYLIDAVERGMAKVRTSRRAPPADRSA